MAVVVLGVVDIVNVVIAARLMRTVASWWGGPSERRRVQSRELSVAVQRIEVSIVVCSSRSATKMLSSARLLWFLWLEMFVRSETISPMVASN